MWNLKAKLIETESSGGCQGLGTAEWEDVDQRVQTSIYKMTEFWETKVQHGDYSFKYTILESCYKRRS